MDTESLGKGEWQFGDTTFVVDHERRDDLYSADRLLMIKSMWMLEHYQDLASSMDVEAVVELGIYQGGSTAFLYEAFHPARLVAIDLSKEAPALTKFIAERGLHDTIRPHYGVNQADAPAVLEILGDDLDGRPIDFVIDDASHFEAPTRASFEAIFPLMRPGGVYVIEDWNWGHYGDEFFAPPEIAAHFRTGRPPTSLVADLVKVVGSDASVISELRVNGAMVEAVRGDASLPAPFDLTDHIVEQDLWSGSDPSSAGIASS